MGEQTAISWCHHTFNLWWGCWKIADECKHCYAEAFARRFRSKYGDLWERTGPRRFFGPDHWNDLQKWNRKAREAGERRNVFIGSMMDWAERHPNIEIDRQMDAFRGRMWHEIKSCDWLNFLLLTKRPENVAPLLPWMAAEAVGPIGAVQIGEPWPNVWLMTTAGTREGLKRVQTLRRIPAAVRGVSCEPLLEDIDPSSWRNALGNHATAVECPTCHAWVGWACEGPEYGAHCAGYHPARERDAASLGKVHWLIIGDESGRKRRPIDLNAVRTAIEAAREHDVIPHLKQLHHVDPAVSGDNRDKFGKIHLPILDGARYAGVPS